MAPEFDSVFGNKFEESSVAVDEQVPQFDIVAWKERSTQLAKSNTDVRWQLGDWLLAGEVYDWPPTSMHDLETLGNNGLYACAETLTGLANSTLRDLANTAKRFPSLSLRTEKLTWSHHRVLINTLPKEDVTAANLKQWLDRATEEQMTVAKLREVATPARKNAKLKRSLIVSVPLSVWETLKDIADDENIAVQEVSAQFLSDYAASEEGMLKRDMARKQTKERRYQKRRKQGKKLARLYPLRENR